VVETASTTSALGGVRSRFGGSGSGWWVVCDAAASSSSSRSSSFGPDALLSPDPFYNPYVSPSLHLSVSLALCLSDMDVGIGDE
jgi:hypothetical protein